MQSRISKWGNSLGIRIPNALAKQTGITDGSSVELSLDGNCLVIQKSNQYSLNDLLSQIRQDNIHDEIDTGLPAGKEIW